MQIRPQAYSALGLEPDASRADITRAYRRLALLTHPDVSGDPQAAQRFASLTDAYRHALTEAGVGPQHPVAPAPAPPPRRSDGRQFVAGPVRVVPPPFRSMREEG